MSDHVHMCLKIPPRYSIVHTIGFLKCKSAVRNQRWILGNKRATGLHFWDRVYCVSSVGLDEATIKKYIHDHDKFEKQQLKLFGIVDQ